jgi:hypothetical protein
MAAVVLGRFISPDPILQLTDPNQIGGYVYAAANPIANSDPSGLQIPSEPGVSGYEDGKGKTGTGTGKGTGKKTGKGGGSNTPLEDDSERWSVRHNAAQQQAAEYLQRTNPNLWIHQEFPIAGASKSGTGNFGFADIVGEDPLTGEWFIWEVKHIGGSEKRATGAEAKGPGDLDWYIKQFESVTGMNMERGEDVEPYLLQPDPLNRKTGTLVTTRARHEGRERGEEFKGVIVYWDRCRDDARDRTMPNWKEEVYTGREALEPPVAPPVSPPASTAPVQESAPSSGFWESYRREWNERYNPSDPNRIPDFPAFPIPGRGRLPIRIP